MGVVTGSAQHLDAGAIGGLLHRLVAVAAPVLVPFAPGHPALVVAQEAGLVGAKIGQAEVVRQAGGKIHGDLVDIGVAQLMRQRRGQLVLIARLAHQGPVDEYLSSRHGHGVGVVREQQMHLDREAQRRQLGAEARQDPLQLGGELGISHPIQLPQRFLPQRLFQPDLLLGAEHGRSRRRLIGRQRRAGSTLRHCRARKRARQRQP